MSETIKTKQPPALYTLFITEMWERFSYYGMRALLILYITRQLLFDDSKAYGVYAAYGALVYATPFLGGLIADKFLGYRKSVIFGGVLMAIGQFMLMVEHELFFYTALSFLIIGNGFFKPNISSMVGGLYSQDDPRKDGGFTIFYMGINLGALLSPIVCGTVGELYGWHYGFGLAGIGMLLGLFFFLKGQAKLGETNGVPPRPDYLKAKVFLNISRETIIYLLSLLVTPLIAFIIFKEYTSVLLPFAIVVLIALFVEAFRSPKIERERIFAIITLIFFSMVFWAFFEQAGSSVIMFTDKNVNRNFWGLTIPTSLTQMYNPAMIVLLGPLFASLWVFLRKRGKEPNTVVKFGLGIIQLGLGFGLYVLGAKLADDNGMVAMIYLVLGYLLQTTGELCLSPVGLSMVTKLAPSKILAMVMGAWFLSSSMAHYVGGTIAKLTSTVAYMQPDISYEPKAKFEGTDQVKIAVSQPAYKNAQNDTLPFEEQYAKDAEKITLTSQPLTITYKVSKKPQANPTKFQFNTYRSVQPGKQLVLNLRSRYLDPNGDLTNIKIIQEPKHGSLQIKSDSDEFIYFANQNFTGQDTIVYTMCEKERPTMCDQVFLIITIDNQIEHAPKASTNEIVVNVKTSTPLSKSIVKANALQYFYDVDNSNLSIEILEKPKQGFLKIKETLNPHVTANKTIHIYAKVFYYITIIAIGVGLFLLLISPIVRKWMHGIH